MAQFAWQLEQLLGKQIKCTENNVPEVRIKWENDEGFKWSEQRSATLGLSAHNSWIYTGKIFKMQTKLITDQDISYNFYLTR